MTRRVCRASFLLGVAALVVVPLGDVAHGYGIPDVPPPTCAACGGRNGNHSNDCPYRNRRGTADAPSETAGDPLAAPIIVAPIGMVVGLIQGGGWYFAEMAGKYPKTGFLASYHQYLSLDTKDPRFDSAWNVGTHIGAAPWLPVYLASWPVRQGILGISRAFTPSAHRSRKAPTARPAVSDVQRERDEFERMNATWVKNQQALLRRRLEHANRTCSGIYSSLKTKVPPRPWRKFTELEAGDVLLIEPDDAPGKLIRLADRLASRDSNSPVSHSLICLKAVKGKKLFLDSTPGKGARIITEDEFQELYGKREAHVAQMAGLTNGWRVAQPLRKDEAEKLWAAAMELVQKERTTPHGPLDSSNYGAWGDDLVCSEASRWALIKAGRTIPATSSSLKRRVGVQFGPADFYDDRQHFIVTPLSFAR